MELLWILLPIVVHHVCVELLLQLLLLHLLHLVEILLDRVVNGIRDESCFHCYLDWKGLFGNMLNFLFLLFSEHFLDVPSLSTNQLFDLLFLLDKHIQIFLLVRNHVLELEHHEQLLIDFPQHV